jgi:hypothetical protein
MGEGAYWCLHGLSTGDFWPALTGLLGDDAAGLSPTAITRLVKGWEAEYAAFRRRGLADRDYVYVWADGVHLNIRLEDDQLWTLVVIGVRPDGMREVILADGGFVHRRLDSRSSTPSGAVLLSFCSATGWSSVSASGTVWLPFLVGPTAWADSASARLSKSPGALAESEPSVCSRSMPHGVDVPGAL